MRGPSQDTEETRDRLLSESAPPVSFFFEDYIGGQVHTLDTNQLEDVIRYRSGTVMPARRGQKPDDVRVCLSATDGYDQRV